MEGKIQPSQNWKECAVPLNDTNKPLIVKTENTGLTVWKPMECLNYNLYSLCSHIIAVAHDTGNLEMIIEYAHKKRICNQKNILDQTNVSMLYPSNALTAIVPDHATNSFEMFIKESTPPSKKLCETEPSSSINQNERKRKNEGNEPNISKRKPSLETSRLQLSKLSKSISFGEVVRPKPPKPEPQM